MKRLSREQKKDMIVQTRFWLAHAGHWMVAAMFIVFTLSLLYTLWGTDPVVASAMIGE